jgi:hypothetical protein
MIHLQSMHVELLSSMKDTISHYDLLLRGASEKINGFPESISLMIDLFILGKSKLLHNCPHA